MLEQSWQLSFFTKVPRHQNKNELYFPLGLPQVFLQSYILIELRVCLPQITRELKGQVARYKDVLKQVSSQYLALINQAGDLYGTILTDAVSTDRTQ